MDEEMKEELINICMEQIREIKDCLPPMSVDGAETIAIYVETIKTILKEENKNE